MILLKDTLQKKLSKEFPSKRWNERSLGKLLKETKTTGSIDSRPGSSCTNCAKCGNCDLIGDFVFRQEIPPKSISTWNFERSSVGRVIRDLFRPTHPEDNNVHGRLLIWAVLWMRSNTTVTKVRREEAVIFRRFCADKYEYRFKLLQVIKEI